MRARVGKIARLPGGIRDELNRGLLNGALGKELAVWLNSLPEVQPILAARFAGRPITEENLSEWRRGGYQDWLRERERRDRLRELGEKFPSASLEERTSRLAAYTEHRLAVELAEELERLPAIADGDERRKRLAYIIRGICRLQNSWNRTREVALLGEKTADRAKQNHDAPTTGGSLWDLLGVKKTGGGS